MRTASSAMLQIIEIDHQSSAPVFERKQVDVFFPQEAPADFPVAMEISPKSVCLLLALLGVVVVCGLCLRRGKECGE